MAQAIEASEAKREIGEGGALLVCAYDDVEKCRKLGAQEASPLRDFQLQVDSMKDREVVFICA